MASLTLPKARVQNIFARVHLTDDDYCLKACACPNSYEEKAKIKVEKKLKVEWMRREGSEFATRVILGSDSTKTSVPKSAV